MGAGTDEMFCFLVVILTIMVTPENDDNEVNDSVPTSATRADMRRLRVDYNSTLDFGANPSWASGSRSCFPVPQLQSSAALTPLHRSECYRKRMFLSRIQLTTSFEWA